MKLSFIQLFDEDVLTTFPDLLKQFPASLQYRFLPKRYATNSAIHIFGDYVVTYTGLTVGKIDEHVVFFIMRSADLAKSYRQWFQYLWDCSPEK